MNRFLCQIAKLIGGTVRGTSFDNGVATVTIAFECDHTVFVSRAVIGRILPKTLFSERYVSLQWSEIDDRQRIRSGDTIERDHSGNAIKVGQLLDRLNPALQPILPDKHASFLGTLSAGLSGRGDKLGSMIGRLPVNADGRTSVLPTIERDIALFADTVDFNRTALPDLIDAALGWSFLGVSGSGRKTVCINPRREIWPSCHRSGAEPLNSVISHTGTKYAGSDLDRNTLRSSAVPARPEIRWLTLSGCICSCTPMRGRDVTAR